MFIKHISVSKAPPHPWFLRNDLTETGNFVNTLCCNYFSVFSKVCLASNTVAFRGAVFHFPKSDMRFQPHCAVSIFLFICWKAENVHAKKNWINLDPKWPSAAVVGLGRWSNFMCATFYSVNCCHDLRAISSREKIN